MAPDCEVLGRGVSARPKTSPLMHRYPLARLTPMRREDRLNSSPPRCGRAAQGPCRVAAGISLRTAHLRGLVGTAQAQRIGVVLLHHLANDR